MSDGDRRGASAFALAVAAILAAALGLRLVPLRWSPLPATLDGFRYADLAERAIASGGIPTGRIQSDELVYTLGLTAASEVVGGAPLSVAQPFTALIGAAAAVAGAAVAQRVGRELGWPARRTRLAAALSGIGLAVEGLYVRRTGVADEEAMALLLVPLLALAVHRTLATGRRAWAATAALLVATLPLVHNMSAVVALFTATGVLALHREGRAGRRATLVGGGLVAAFWAYFWGYYPLVARFGLEATYRSVVGDRLGLFAAWLVALVAGLRWFGRASTRARRAAYALPFGVAFAVVVANALAPVFPGTVPSPRPIVALVALYVVPVAAGIGALGAVGRAPTGAVVVAGLAAPLALVYYALTASLTPEFFDAILRVQTFLHPSVFALAGLALAALVDGRALARARSIERPDGALRTAAVALFVVALVGSIPLAYAELDTGTYPATTTPSEFGAATFATERLDSPFAAADPVTRVSHYYYADDRARTAPAGEWLSGGDPPACPLVSRRSWTRAGAHLYPAAPESVTPTEHARLRARRNLVYASSGIDPIYVTVPRNGTGEGC